jgi:HPt (histidine-containing phosphotransfer) domain-containing protein
VDYVGSHERSFTGNQLPDQTLFVETDFDDFRKMMSGEEVSSWLRRLSDELRRTFFDRPVEALDRSQLARHAHAIVSQAGFLGFSDLARICGTLEEACAMPADLSAPFEQASLAARAVCARINTLGEQGVSDSSSERVPAKLP